MNTLTKKEIEEGDRIISEFMNEKLDPSKVISDKTIGKKLWVDLIKKQLRTEIPPYNKSWDWLMPVWFKFRDLKVELVGHQMSHSDYKDDISHAICYGDIMTAWTLLVSGIKWYKKQNIKNEYTNTTRI